MAPLLTDVEKIFYLAAQSRTSVGVYETSPLSLEPVSNRRNVRNEGTFSLKAVKAMLFLILFFFRLKRYYGIVAVTLALVWEHSTLQQRQSGSKRRWGATRLQHYTSAVHASRRQPGSSFAWCSQAAICETNQVLLPLEC